ncbi:MAG: CBS domain-containing protein, partial [Alphaproteobacteria bacterium]|nr:CBS domain-containing protein [Alphaproteobacteria bacterium]
MEPHSKSATARRETNLSRESEDSAPIKAPQSKDTLSTVLKADTSAPQAEHSAPPSFLQALGNWFRGNNADAAVEEAPKETTLKETLQSLIAEHEKEGQELVIVPEERNMLSNILRFGEMTVSDIMIPRPDIVAVEYSVSLEELKQQVVREQHSRMPVYKENLDNIEGFLHIKDLAVQVFEGKPFSMETSIRQILFVPPSMRLMDLLIKMRLSS